MKFLESIKHERRENARENEEMLFLNILDTHVDLRAH